MKKYLTLVCILLSSITLISQSIYIKPFGGYGFKINGEIVTEESSSFYENDDSIHTSFSYEAFKLANGKGPRFGLAIGIDISEHIGFEIGAYHTKSSTPEIKFTENVLRDFNETYYLNLSHSYYLESNSWQFSPEISIKGNPALFTPYLKLGAIISTTQVIEYYDIFLHTNFPGYYPFSNMDRVLEYDRKSSIGFTGTIGCNIQLMDNFYIFSELRYSNIYNTPDKAEITKYNVNGSDELGSLENNERYYEFVESYSDEDNLDPDEPSKSTYQRFDLSNISLIVGLKICIDLNKDTNPE